MLVGQSICCSLLQQVLLPTHDFFLLFDDLLLSVELIAILWFLYFQCFFCNDLSLLIRRRSSLFGITSLLDMRIFRWEHLFLLVEHGGRLIRLSEHVKESRLLLPYLIVLNDPLLPLKLVNQHVTATAIDVVVFSLFGVNVRVLWRGLIWTVRWPGPLFFNVASSLLLGRVMLVAMVYWLWY